MAGVATSETRRPGDRRVREVILVFGGLLLFTYAYFYQAGGWGQNVRFDLVRAIVEQHTLTIDAYHENTGDKARNAGHYYLDKPPGVSLTAVPFVGLSHVAMKGFGVAPSSNRGVVVGSYVATIFAASLPAAIAALALWWVALELGATMGGALFAAGVLALGSPYFTYATVLWSYGLAGGGLVVAFAAAVALRRAGSARRDTALGLTVGLAAGWATVSELNCGVAAVLLTVLVALTVGRERRLRVLGALAAGAIATASVLMIYNFMAFGGPLTLGYERIKGDFSIDSTGGAIYGVMRPRASVFWQITMGARWGLFPLAPILLAAPVGYYLLIRDPATRRFGIVAASIVVVFFTLNASLFFWTGGGNLGPRHVGPSLPLLALGLAPVFGRLPRWGKAVAGAIAAWGLVIALACVATAVVPSADDPGGPVPEILSRFARGELANNEEAFYFEAQPWAYPRDPAQAEATRDSWNLGQLVGLGRGLPTLLPLVLAWLVVVGWWWRRRDLGGT